MSVVPSPLASWFSVTAGFLLALVGLLVIGAFAVHNTQVTTANSAERTQVRLLLVEMKDLYSDLQDAETGQRGFLLTGDENYLAPYLGARATIDDHLATIARLIAPVDPESHYLDEAQRLISAKLAELATTITARRANGVEAAITLMRSNDGKRIMDDFRLLHDAQEQRVDSAMTARTIAAERNNQQVFITLLIGGLAGLSVLSLSFFWLRREVTARRSQATMLDQHQTRLNSIFAMSPDLIGLANTKGFFTQVNPSFSRTLGWSDEELLTQPFFTFIHPDDMAATIAEVEKLAQGIATLRFENRYHCKDGSYRWIFWSCQPQPDGSLHTIGRDVTDAKRDEDLLRTTNVALRLATEQAQSADRLKSAFLATMSHELRTPLNSIIGFTGILLQGLAGPLNAEQAKQLGMVRDSSRHLLSLINDVLDLSKIEAGQMEVTCTPFVLDESISTVIGIVTPQAQAKGLRLRVEHTADIGTLVSDRRRVEQVLLNLLSNAIKFTDQGEIVLNVGRSAVDNQLHLTVADTGIGITAKHLPTLFQPFRQLHTGLGRAYEGTGLGLAICRRLLDLLGGAITAESREGHGSVFTIMLPLPAGETA